MSSLARSGIAVFIAVLAAAAYGPALLAQATGAEMAAAGSGEATETVASFVWAYASASLLEWWKKNPALGGMQKSANLWVQRAIAGATAFASSLGIHAVFDPTAGTLLISGLFVGTVTEAAGEGIRQFVFQQFIYRSAIEPTSKHEKRVEELKARISDLMALVQKVIPPATPGATVGG